MAHIRTLKIVCARCGKRRTVAQKQGKPRIYCDPCDVIVKREQTRDRMRRLRERRRPASPVVSEYASFLARWGLLPVPAPAR